MWFCSHLDLRELSGPEAEMDVSPQGQRKFREIMEPQISMAQKVHGDCSPSTLISSLSLHLLHILRTPSEETEAQRQKIYI